MQNQAAIAPASPDKHKITLQSPAPVLASSKTLCIGPCQSWQTQNPAAIAFARTGEEKIRLHERPPVLSLS